MPYITQDRRKELLVINNALGSVDIKDGGELNYLLTIVADRYLRHHGKCYKTINDIAGAFTNAQAEFYRRVAAPYEDDKIVMNGDVYEPF